MDENKKEIDTNVPYVIAIGRQFGSGGRVIAKMIADRLGIGYYDRQLLMDAAKHSGLNPELFHKSDERSPSFLGGCLHFNFGANAFGANAGWMGASAINDDSIYKAQCDFIHALSERESCVILGRTADYVLRDNPRCISVFLHASLESRIKRILSRHDAMTESEAKMMAERHNKIRANYYNFYTDKRWGESASYHLSLDTSSIPYQDVVDIIVGYVKKRLS